MPRFKVCEALNHSLGPGQYKLPSEIKVRSNNSFTNGTAAFVGSIRKSPVDINRNSFDIPGPGEYETE